MNNRYSRFTIIAVVLIMLGASNNLHWGENNWLYTLDADAKGYFAYLPAVFIYQDLNYTSFDEMEGEKYFIDSQHYDYRVKINERYTNKYFAGTALMCAPFYLVAHGASLVLGFDADGYSFPYVLSVMLAALFYLALGLFFFDKFMMEYDVTSTNRVITLLALAFGTHLFNYSVVEPGFSHVYSFALVSMFMYFTNKWANFGKGLVAMGALLGLIILIRPVNVLLVFFIPFLCGGFSSYIRSVKIMFLKKKELIASLACCFAIAFIQPLINKLAVGQFWIDTYPGEAFNFADPYFFNILFSYKKGLFLYTPVCLLALIGLWPLFRKNRGQAILWILAMVITVYVFSSWHNWWYGGSFSARPFVEYLPMFMILLAMALQNTQIKWQRVVLIGSVVLFVVINQVQTYQYRYYEIHYEDMTKEQYWDSFLRIDRLIKE